MRRMKLYYEFDCTEAKKLMSCIKDLKELIEITELNVERLTCQVDMGYLYKLNDLLNLLESETEVYG